jgi:hypothetical protein
VTIRVVMSELTLDEMAAAGEVLGDPVDEVIAGPARFRGLAALAYVVVRRDDPDFTWEQAKALHLRDIEVVEADPEKVPAGSNGGAPVLLPASGS